MTAYLLDEARASPVDTTWLGEDHATFWAKRRDVQLYYQTLIELSGQIPFLADKSGHIRTIAAQWQELTGIPVRTVLERGIGGAIHPTDSRRMTAAWWEAIKTGTRFDEHCQMRRVEGRYGWVRVRGCQLRHDDGEVSWLGTIEDTDAQHRLHAEALAAEERYRLASSATHDLIWDHDLITDRIRLGAAASTMLGRDPPTEFVSLDWCLDQIHPADRPMVERSYIAACRGNQRMWFCDYRVCRNDDYVVVSACAYIARDERGRALRMVGAARDLTAELKLDELQAELVRVSQVSEMGAMASMLAHELNQPLTAVTGYIRGAQRLLTQQGAAGIQRSVEALSLAADTALAAGAMVRRLRDLVARGDASIAVHDLVEIVEQACTLALVGAPQWQIERQVDIEPAARRVAVDQVQISQVLVNLLRNAVAAMHHVSHRQLIIRAHAQDECAEISVTDTGSGISPDRQARLFQPFTSTTSAGMGIGLSICRVMVEANGGHIWLNKSDENGTEFRFTVPLAEGKE